MWTILCTIKGGSRGRVIQLNLVRLVELLFSLQLQFVAVLGGR